MAGESRWRVVDEEVSLDGLFDLPGPGLGLGIVQPLEVLVVQGAPAGETRASNAYHFEWVKGKGLAASKDLLKWVYIWMSEMNKLIMNCEGQEKNWIEGEKHIMFCQFINLVQEK